MLDDSSEKDKIQVEKDYAFENMVNFKITMADLQESSDSNTDGG